MVVHQHRQQVLPWFEWSSERPQPSGSQAWHFPPVTQATWK